MSSDVAEMQRATDVMPVDWREVAVTDVVAMLPGFAFKSENFVTDTDAGLPLIRIRDLDQTTTVTRYVGDYDEAFAVQDGDILVGMDGAFEVVRWRGGKALLNQRVLKLTSARPSAMDEGYLFYRVQPALAELEQTISGTTVKHLSTKDLRRLTWQLPPLDEQRWIAEVLRSVDETIAAAVAVRETTCSLLHSVRHNAFSDAKKIVDFASVITLVSGQHVDTEQCNKVGLGVPYLTGPSDFPDGEISVTKFTTTPSVMCQPGDILITVKGSGVGKAVIAHNRYCIIRQLMALRSNELPTAFLFEALQMVVEELNTEASGPIPGITRGHILVKPIPVMERSAQESLAATFSSLREQLRFANEHLELLGVLKSSLMSDLLSGRGRMPA